MFEEIVAGLAVTGIAGAVGFILKSRFFTKPTYLPEIPFPSEINAYRFMAGTWHEYHYTFDPKIKEPRYLTHAVAEIALEKNLVITGEAKVQVSHRRSLNYKIRGQVNSGNLYYTGVCVEDPSDAYTAMFKNLLDDQVSGIISGWDYDKCSYTSPILLSKVELSEEEVEKILLQSKIKNFGEDRVL